MPAPLRLSQGSEANRGANVVSSAMGSDGGLTQPTGKVSGLCLRDPEAKDVGRLAILNEVQSESEPLPHLTAPRSALRRPVGHPRVRVDPHQDFALLMIPVPRCTDLDLVLMVVADGRLERRRPGLVHREKV